METIIVTVIAIFVAVWTIMLISIPIKVWKICDLMVKTNEMLKQIGDRLSDAEIEQR